MISRTLSVLGLLAIMVLSMAQDISPGVRYKKATPQVNAAFVKLLSSLHDKKFSDKERDALFGKAVMCGPNLYGVLKRQLPDAARSGKLLKITVPVKGGAPQELEGRLYNTKDDIDDFALTVQSMCTIAPIKVRKPTKDELDYYWAMIPYDIEEPIFVVENSHMSLLVNGDEAGLILYVELIPRQHKD
ncbi:MAG TPA: hypothetical protein VGL56_04155 [Fimbriimonadaceae bacterium]|jgi:hypothetical protein